MILGVVAVVLAASAVGAYWHWLRASAPPPPRGAAISLDRLAHGGRERSYAVYRGRSYRPGAAVVLAFHHSGSSARAMRRVTGYELERLAEEHGFLLVYPEGVRGHWNDCRRAGRFAAKRLGVDDVGFVRALVARLRDDGATGPVLALGYSNGGHMCFRLALDAPELVDAIGVFAANLPTSENCACAPPSRFVPLLLVNGTRDPINPYAGGHVSLFGWDDRGTVRSSEETAAYFAALAGAPLGQSAAEVTVPRAPGIPTAVERTTWSRDGEVRVALYTVRGGGHVVPQPRYRAPRLIGATEQRFDALAAAWQFFERVAPARASDG